MSLPTLVTCSHGTASPEGSAAVTRLTEAVREAGDMPVVEAFVDVHGPFVDAVVRGLDGHAVVVPVLLAAGFHVRVDIAGAVAPFPEAVAASALGPDQRITSMLLDRMATAGVRRGDHVVLASAGSSDDMADESVRQVARELADAWGAPVTVAYGAAREPRVVDEVTRLREQEPGSRVAVVSYLLATGHFHRRLLGSGADVVTAPLLDHREPDPRMVGVVLDRYAAARRTVRSAP